MSLSLRADTLAHTNPKFKRSLFLSDCGAEELAPRGAEIVDPTHVEISFREQQTIKAPPTATNGEGEDDQQYRDWNMSDEDMDAAHDALDKAYPSGPNVVYDTKNVPTTVYDGKTVAGGTFERGE